MGASAADLPVEGSPTAASHSTSGSLQAGVTRTTHAGAAHRRDACQH